MKAAGASPAQGQLLQRIYRKGCAALAAAFGRRPALPESEAAADRKPLIIIGRQVSNFCFPRSRRVLWAGDCARDNPDFRPPGLKGCPPAAADILRALS
jgi:hypothetical protein